MEGLIDHIIAAKLILSECDLSKRHDIFDQIIHHILNFEKRPTVTIINEVMRKYCIPFDYLLPFLQYYNSFCEKQGDLFSKHSSYIGVSEEISLIDDRKKIVAYKNSLQVTNHFEKICGKVDFPPIQISFQSSEKVGSDALKRLKISTTSRTSAR